MRKSEYQPKCHHFEGLSSLCWLKTYTRPHNAIFKGTHTHIHTHSFRHSHSSKLKPLSQWELKLAIRNKHGVSKHVSMEEQISPQQRIGLYSLCLSPSSYLFFLFHFYLETVTGRMMSLPVLVPYPLCHKSSLHVSVSTWRSEWRKQPEPDWSQQDVLHRKRQMDISIKSCQRRGCRSCGQSELFHAWPGQCGQTLLAQLALTAGCRCLRTPVLSVVPLWSP